MAENNYISYSIKIGSKTYTSQGPFVSILTHTEINKIPFASIALTDGDPSKQDFELSSGNVFNPGEKISIELGFNGKNSEVFSGIIIRHRIKSRNAESSLLLIECKHATLKMCGGRKTTYFEGKDDKAILEALYDECSVGGSLSCEGEFLKSDSSMQFDVSNWDFFMLRAQANSKVVLFDGDNVFVSDLKLSGSPTKTYNYGQDILEYESEADAENLFSKVEGYSWDSDKQEVVKISGAPSSFKQLENDGVKISDLEGVLSVQNSLIHGGEISKEELTSWGNSKADIASLSKIKGRIKILGDSTIKVGDVISIKGVGSKFSGNVLVSAIRQEVNSSGWATHIQFGLSADLYTDKDEINSPPAANLLPSVNGLQIGKVLKIDGDEKYRVQVALPVAGDEVYVWARMIFEDAGNNRGKIFWPEKDDEVIVGFLNADPRSPVILGSLFSKVNVPPIKPEEENNEKGIISREEIKIIINDEDKSINIKTPSGNTIILDDKKKSIFLEDQNQNSVKLDGGGISLVSKGDISIEASKKVSIKADMDIEIEGMNVKNTAKAKFSADGSAGSELTTSAIAIVKGSMVKIN